MKKNYTVIFLLVFLNSSYAQPVINSDWFNSIGDTVLTAFHYPSTAMPLEEGIDVIWDFSNATPANGERENIYVSPSELTNFNEFPDANLAYYRAGYITEFYLKKDGDELLLLGAMWNDNKRIYLDGGQPVGFNNFEFEDANSKTYPELLVNLQSMDTSFFTIDDELVYAGFGTVITPIETYEDCVMTKLTNSKSTDLSTTSYVEYKFYKDNFANLIAVYRFYTSGNVEPSKRIEYQIDQSTINVNELDKSILKIYGPIANSIFINSLSKIDAKIQIFNMSGQLIIDHSRILQSGNNELKIDALAANNTYILLITDLNSGSFVSYKYYK